MFGESDSESPRVPSPWDSLTSTPPTPPNDDILRRGLPKLVPESEEGNVEYKLHLLSPSPSRFTHLVTQLKWRLLEGGGQAYYELGVADSGLLIGLERREMEETLATLEEMAGEIGASVIVVKEIEVPAEVSGVVGSSSGDGHRWRQRQVMSEDSEVTTTTKTELEVDADDEVPAASSYVEVFSMDEGGWSSESTTFTMDLEIATVFKPRPFRRRASTTMHGHLDRRKGKGKGKKPRLLAHNTQPTHPERHTHHLPHSNLHTLPVPIVPTHSTEPQTHITSESKKSKRCASGDKRRETKCSPPHLQVPALRIGVEEMGELVSDLESFHVTLESEHSASMQLEPCMGEHSDLVTDGLGSPAYAPNSFPFKPNPGVETRSTPSSISSGPYQQSETVTNEFDTPKLEMMTPPKSHNGDIKKASLAPRLIVEALVVRKMSLEEAFLDFGGFSVL